MSTPSTLKLPRASAIALKLQESMQPYCHQIEIAGSIRRAKPYVGDVDFVILPRDRAGLEQRIHLAGWERVTEGPQNCIYRVKLSDGFPLQIDIFYARPTTSDLFKTTPTNFGTLLLCRTGSKEHNIKLVEHAKKMGLRWNPYEGVFDAHDRLLASETETAIFRALELDYLAPRTAKPKP
jgi:DNA polymerase/3'-5' exonuclease PolX